MPAPGRTTARGYGWAHRKRVAELHRQHRDGDPCRRCGQPMYQSQPLDGGHPPGADPRLDPPDALEHAWCNRRAGQATAASRRTQPHIHENARWML